MFESYDPSQHHRVTLDAKQQASSVQGPHDLRGLLCCIEQPIGPGGNLEVAIFFDGMGIGLVRTVTGAATELSPPSTPWRGDASFTTFRVVFDQQYQVAAVGFSMDWSGPLPCAFMLTVGATGFDETESVPGPAPRAQRATYRLRNPDPIAGDVQRDSANIRPDRSSAHDELAVRTAGAEAGPLLREDQLVAGVYGPFSVTSLLFASARDRVLAQPGFNTLTIDLSQFDWTPWTVSASVSQLAPPQSPIFGDARIYTLGVQLRQPESVVYVYCLVDSNSDIPVAVLLTVGYA